MEWLFLGTFTLHNLEEAVWLPGWSRQTGGRRLPITEGEFRFAVTVVTVAGYALTGAFLLYGGEADLRDMYVGFVAMIGLNALFPHLMGTIVLQRYMPGTLTGVLNLLLGAGIIEQYLEAGLTWKELLLNCLEVTAVTLAALPLLFKLGGWLGRKVA